MKEKRIKLIFCIVILIVIFFFMGKYMYENWQKVPFQKLKFNWTFLVIAYLSQVCTFILSGLIWKVNLSYIKENLGFIESLRVKALSCLPKYIPGKVWGMASQVWLTKKEGGIPEEKGGICIVLETVISILSGLLLAIIILPFVLKNNFSSNFYLLFALIPLFFIALYPPIFMKIANFGLRTFKRKIITYIPKYSQILKLLFLCIIFWISQCIGIFFLIKSFYPIDYSFFLPLCGIHPLSWLIGFMSFVTPGGLGVREGTLAYLLSFYMPTSMGIMTSLIIRIWATIVELVFFAIFARNIKKYI